MIDVIYIRGGVPRAPDIARRAGMKYGIRHDYTAYGDVYMLDIAWERFKRNPEREWQRYQSKLAKVRPVVAMVQDFEQHIQPSVIYAQVSTLLDAGVQRVMVCPKRRDWQRWIPVVLRQWIIIAMSMPAPSYDSYPLPPETLMGWDVHLLGGNVRAQAEWISRINAAGGQVVSADNSHYARKAALGQMWDGGRFIQVIGASTEELEIASSRAIVKTLQLAERQAQPSLFMRRPW